MKMDTLNFKKCMTKDEVALLVDLVTSIPVLTSKETNAATNKLKEEAWVTLAAEFNSKSSYIPRNLTQLKLKWDNLKKAARKRSQQIRRISLKNGGSKSEYIQPDEILDKVSSHLGPSTGDNGISVDDEPPHTHSTEVKKRKIDDLAPSLHITKMAKPLHICTGNETEKDTGVKERNLAIARYYEIKTEKIGLEIQLLKSRYYEKNTEKLDLEIELLKSKLNSRWSRRSNSPPIRWDYDDEDQ